MECFVFVVSVVTYSFCATSRLKKKDPGCRRDVYVTEGSEIGIVHELGLQQAVAAREWKPKVKHEN